MSIKQQAVNQQVNNLKNFTEVIKIEVDVQTIYEKLMSEFPEDYKHKEIVSHAIIGTAIGNGALVHIYNALNGYPNTINFEVGQVIMCSEKDKYEVYDSLVGDEDGEVYATPKTDGAGLSVGMDGYKPNLKTRKVEIGKCVIEEIDMYSRTGNKLKVSFMGAGYSNDSSITKKTEWVNHKNCAKWGDKVAVQVVDNVIAK